MPGMRQKLIRLNLRDNLRGSLRVKNVKNRRSHVEEYELGVFEVEFCDGDGRAYAIETLFADVLMVLHHQSKELAIV
jgi:hypothetical protein